MTCRIEEEGKDPIRIFESRFMEFRSCKDEESFSFILHSMVTSRLQAMMDAIPESMEKVEKMFQLNSCCRRCYLNQKMYFCGIEYVLTREKLRRHKGGCHAEKKDKDSQTSDTCTIGGSENETSTPGGG